MLVRLGDNSFDSTDSGYWAGGDYSEYGPGSPSYGEVYGGGPNYVEAPIYTEPDAAIDPYAGMDLSNLGLTFDTTTTEVTPYAGSQTTLITPPSDITYQEPSPFSSSLPNIFGPSPVSTTPAPISITPVRSTPTRTPTPTPTVKAPTPTKPSVPAKATTKPSPSGAKPDVGAYERLFQANLANFLASGRTATDQLNGENYFTQEWAVFAADMNSAGSWGTQGLSQRNRGGSLDWWHLYYDPIAMAQVSSNYGAGGSSTGINLSSGVGSSGIGANMGTIGGMNVGLLLLMAAGVAFAFMWQSNER